MRRTRKRLHLGAEVIRSLDDLSKVSGGVPTSQGSCQCSGPLQCTVSCTGACGQQTICLCTIGAGCYTMTAC